MEIKQTYSFSTQEENNTIQKQIKDYIYYKEIDD